MTTRTKITTKSDTAINRGEIDMSQTYFEIRDHPDSRPYSTRYETYKQAERAAIRISERNWRQVLIYRMTPTGETFETAT